MGQPVAPSSHYHQPIPPLSSPLQLSFGSILTPLGVGLLAYGFGAFFQLLPGTDASPLMLIYGFPISLLGFALSYAQLRPVPCATTAGAAAVREAQATDIQKQLRDDVTRFRYGDEQHLEEALNRVFQFGRSTGIPRRLAPTLVGVREELTGPNKAYTLVLEFETKPEMTLEMWTDRQAKIEGFFGPGITVRMAWSRVSGCLVVWERQSWSFAFVWEWRSIAVPPWARWVAPRVDLPRRPPPGARARPTPRRKQN